MAGNLAVRFLADGRAMRTRTTVYWIDQKKARSKAGFFMFGSPTRTRTTDILINSQTLYQLSYRGIGRQYKVRAGILVDRGPEVKP